MAIGDFLRNRTKAICKIGGGKMNSNMLIGILIPFLGTSLGAACVFLLKNEINAKVQKSILGFASGVMVAASIWSLLIPSMDMSESMGKLSFIPAVTGFIVGVAFLLFMDKLLPHLHLDSDKPEGIKSNLGKSTMMLLAVTLHNIPEGAAVGIVFAGAMSGNNLITLAGALALSIGIALQNFPEGAIISIPLKQEVGKKKAFIYGVLSGVVEPVAAIITILLAKYINPILPYMLAFAAGAMMFVVVEELIPESAEGEHSNIATIGFTLGFVIMMILDVTLG